MINLYDPTMLTTMQSGFLLGGIELQVETTGGARLIYEHQQVWLVIPAAGI